MKRLSQEEFINKSNLKHKYFYTYNNSIYINSRTKISITCPIHGEFCQLPSVHISGQGCPKCYNSKVSKRQLFSLEDFILLLKNKKPNLELVSKFNGKSKPIIVTDEYGNYFKSLASNVIASGFPSINSAIYKTKYFIFLSKKIHGSTYTYESSIYSGDKNKLIITCSIHGDFEQQPSNHLNGAGCPHCKTKGYTRTEWVKFCNKNNYKKSTLYLIKCFNNDEVFYKIGITNKSIKKRFYNKQLMPYKYEIIKEIKNSPEYIFDLEKRIHSRYLKQKYIPKIKFSGYTECFN